MDKLINKATHTDWKDGIKQIKDNSIDLVVTDKVFYNTNGNELTDVWC